MNFLMKYLKLSTKKILKIGIISLYTYITNMCKNKNSKKEEIKTEPKQYNM